MKNTKIAAALAALLLAAGYSPARAERLLSDEKAIGEMLPGSETVEKVSRPVTAPELEALKGKLNGSLQVDGKGADPKELVFYFGMKGGKKTGVAMLDTQPGKWGIVGYAIGLDLATGKIANMAVTTLSEKRGRPIVLKSFLKQFFGKGIADAFVVGKDVNAVSGATVSSKASAFAARKASVVYSSLYLK